MLAVLLALLTARGNDRATENNIMFVYTGTLALSDDDDDDDDERSIKASKMTTLTSRVFYGHGKDSGKR